MEIDDFANEAPNSNRIAMLSSFLVEESIAHSPIDQYLRAEREILALGSRDLLEQHKVLGRLLLVGLVSAVEAYIRSVLSACLELCPVARKHASKQNVSLGGLLWHGQTGFSRSAFEHSSFASKDEIVSGFKRFLNIEISEQSFGTVLNEFEQVCQLRHGIVHGDGFLPGRNAVLLDIPKYNAPIRITAKFQEIQEVAAVLNMTVFSLNRFAFRHFCNRWAVDWRKRSDWNSRSGGRRFTELWALFHSAASAEARGDNSCRLKEECKKMLLKKVT